MHDDDAIKRLEWEFDEVQRMLLAVENALSPEELLRQMTAAAKVRVRNTAAKIRSDPSALRAFHLRDNSDYNYSELEQLKHYASLFFFAAVLDVL